MRFIHFFVLSILLLLLIISTTIYLYDLSFSLQNFIESETYILKPSFQWIMKMMRENDAKSWWGIAGCFGLFALYIIPFLLKRPKNESPHRYRSKAPYIIVPLTFVLAGLLWSAVYFYPEDTISIGNLFKIHRGPKEMFAEQTIHVAILVAVVHLFLFLVISLYHCIFFEGNPTKKE